MARIRSKLKRRAVAKGWHKGHSSTTNPTNIKYRNRAKRNFLQQNLDNCHKTDENLTVGEVVNHEIRQLFSDEKYRDMTISTIQENIANLKMEFSQMADESRTQTFASSRTFASDYSACSHISFEKFLANFRADNPGHRNLLAIITALTEVIKEQNGTECSADYFLLLVKKIEDNCESEEVASYLKLLSLIIKTVPKTILNLESHHTSEILRKCIELLVGKQEPVAVKNAMKCLSIVLKAQNFSFWSNCESVKYFETILICTVNLNSKIRNAAQSAIAEIILESTFVNNLSTFHPAGEKVATFCIEYLSLKNIKSNENNLLYTLQLLNKVICGFKDIDIKNIHQCLIPLIVMENTLITNHCFKIYHRLFSSRKQNLNDNLCQSMINALLQYRPDYTDGNEINCWLTTLKEGYIHIANANFIICVDSFKIFLKVCQDFWSTCQPDMIKHIFIVLKDIFNSFKPSFALPNLVDHSNGIIVEAINMFTTILSQPLAGFEKYVILTLAALIDACGETFGDQLRGILLTLFARYDTMTSWRTYIEHIALVAIGAMGPEKFLKIIPLTIKTGDFYIERSWLLPLLREGICSGSFSHFKNVIYPLAVKSHEYFLDYEKKNSIQKHTFELLSFQLWGLFPSYCKKPKDPKNFHELARIVGEELKNNIGNRMPILDGLKTLLESTEKECSDLMIKYAENFIRILLNLYIEKPNSSYEQEIRKLVLDVITQYLGIMPFQTVLKLFELAQLRYKTEGLQQFSKDALFEISNILILHLDNHEIKEYLENVIYPILRKKSSNQKQKQAFQCLFNILENKGEYCSKFIKENEHVIYNLLVKQVIIITNNECHILKLKCLKCLLSFSENNLKENQNDNLLEMMSETILISKQLPSKKENVVQDIVLSIGKIYDEIKQTDKLINFMMSGLYGEAEYAIETTFALRLIVQYYSKNLTYTTTFLLIEKILEMFNLNRNTSQAAIKFLLAFVKGNPVEIVESFLEKIINALSLIRKDVEKFCRKETDILMMLLCKKIGSEKILKFLPEADKNMQKRLKNLKKQLKRNALKKKTGHENNGVSEDMDCLEKKTITFDEVLADSDSSESDPTDENEIQQRKKSKSDNIYIQESPDDIIDFTDTKSMSKITNQQPGTMNNIQTKIKPPNRGFKTAKDGRLIIVENNENSGDDSDSELEENFKENEKSLKRKQFQDLTDDDVSENENISEKRNGKTGRFASKGIYRRTAKLSKTNQSKIKKSTKKNFS